MQITNNQIYVVTVGNNRDVYDGEDEAINSLEDVKNISERDNVEVVEVTIEGDGWTIAEVPWQKIAFKLL